MCMQGKFDRTESHPEMLEITYQCSVCALNFKRTLHLSRSIWSFAMALLNSLSSRDMRSTRASMFCLGTFAQGLRTKNTTCKHIAQFAVLDVAWGSLLQLLYNIFCMFCTTCAAAATALLLLSYTSCTLCTMSTHAYAEAPTWRCQWESAQCNSSHRARAPIEHANGRWRRRFCWCIAVTALRLHIRDMSASSAYEWCVKCRSSVRYVCGSVFFIHS